MDAHLAILPARLLYIMLPAKGLRQTVDGLFPQLANFPLADSAASGKWHRYAAGHDLLLDVPATIQEYGVLKGIHHTGHILLTDFPTKAGIPIPGLSQAGLGEYLREAGITRGWLNLNLCDAGIGILAVSEGASDLQAAINGTLEMNRDVFFDTFVEGSLEIALGTLSENPLLLMAGFENILAGVVATFQSISVYVDPVALFGSAFFSMAVGFSVGRWILNGSPPQSILNAFKGGAVGTLFAIFPPFGFGAIGGILIYSCGRTLAQRQSSIGRNYFNATNEGVRQYIAELSHQYPDIENLLKEINSKQFLLCSRNTILHSGTPTLSTDGPLFSRDRQLLKTDYGFSVQPHVE